MASSSQNLYVDDDGLITPEVGVWAETKYRLLALYDELFSTGMKNKWDQRAYIDLYAGTGYSRIQGTGKYLKGSPVIALTVPDCFDKYIFCEERGDLLDALKVRAGRIAPQANVAYIPGNCDAEIDRICKEIPKGSPTNRVLSLCVVDPFDFGLKFETLRRLSTVFVDFVVLLAIGMDANRNYEHYVEGDSTKIDEALGNTEWRERWKSTGLRRSDFRPFLADEFSVSMESLGYLRKPRDRMKLVRSTDKKLPLYYLALFSRNETAFKFWDDVLKYGTDQTGLVGSKSMSLLSRIEWTDATWNPVRGCTKISPACKHCYAERFAERFRGVKGHPFEQGFDLLLVPKKLCEPLRWSKPSMVFVNSMSDLFHEAVPLSYIAKVAETMRLANWHTYQVLTKRSQRLRELLSGPLRTAATDAHIWWGVSVEDRKYGLPRIADLQATPAAVRFLSVEPLLEDLGKLPLNGISWVIVGGESGPGARPMKEDWVLSIREQCEAARVPFFFKQWGGVRKKAAGRTLRGRTHDDFPARAENPTLPALQRLKHALEIESAALVQLV